MDGVDNLIVIEATDVDGRKLQQSISVLFQPEQKKVTLVSNLESSLSPMETSIRIDTNFSTTGDPMLSYTGPGTVELLESNDPMLFNIRILDPGLYFFTGEIQDQSGITHSDTLAILAIEQNAFDTLLQAKWYGMKMALSNGQFDIATEYFHPITKSSYQAQFEALSSVMPQIISDMGKFRLVEHDGYGAIYDLRTIRDDVELSFQVLFIQDGDGIWKIYNY